MKIIFILVYGAICFLGSVWCRIYIRQKTGFETLGGMMNFILCFTMATACAFLIARPLNSDFIGICGYFESIVVCLIVAFLDGGSIPIGKEEEPDGKLPNTYLGALEKAGYPLKRIFGAQCEYCGRRFWRKKGILTCHTKEREEGKMPSGWFGTGYGKWKNRDREVMAHRNQALLDWAARYPDVGKSYFERYGGDEDNTEDVFRGYPSSSHTYTRYDNRIQSDGGVTYEKVGGSWVGSDGSSIKSGETDLSGNNIAYGSNGVTYTGVQNMLDDGKTIYGSDGSTHHETPNIVFGGSTINKK